MSRKVMSMAAALRNSIGKGAEQFDPGRASFGHLLQLVEEMRREASRLTPLLVGGEIQDAGSAKKTAEANRLLVAAGRNVPT
jgi:hypothetical protein